jgi:hypothetical protein
MTASRPPHALQTSGISTVSPKIDVDDVVVPNMSSWFMTSLDAWRRPQSWP